MKFALQLYSLRELIKVPEDLLALFPKVKALGFDGVEFAGYQGLPAARIRAALDDAGLVAAGTHMGLKDLELQNLPATIEYCKTLGLKYIGIGGAPHATAKETAKSCAVLRKAYAEGLKHDVVIYYHNHVHEFKKFRNGVMAIDMFMEACPLQLDTCWSYCGGADNYAFIMKNRDRICLLHIKDCKSRIASAALGEGVVPLAEVVKAAKEIGMEWLILEDETTGTGMESVTKGIQWLKANA